VPFSRFPFRFIEGRGRGRGSGGGGGGIKREKRR